MVKNKLTMDFRQRECLSKSVSGNGWYFLYRLLFLHLIPLDLSASSTDMLIVFTQNCLFETRIEIIAVCMQYSLPFKGKTGQYTRFSLTACFFF